MLFEFPSSLTPHSGETKRAPRAVRARACACVRVVCMRARTCLRLHVHARVNACACAWGRPGPWAGSLSVICVPWAGRARGAVRAEPHRSAGPRPPSVSTVGFGHDPANSSHVIKVAGVFTHRHRLLHVCVRCTLQVTALLGEDLFSRRRVRIRTRTPAAPGDPASGPAGLWRVCTDSPGRRLVRVSVSGLLVVRPWTLSSEL